VSSKLESGQPDNIGIQTQESNLGFAE